MAMPPLRALHAAEAVGRLRNLSRASAELGVTPSAVSHQIRRLEAHLGLALFDRTEAGLVPTATGARLLPALTEGFQVIGDGLSLIGEPAPATLTVSCGMAFAARFLVPRLSDWATRHPGIEIRLATTSRLVEFDREDIDLGVRFGRGDWPGLKAARLADQDLLPVCTPVLRDRLERGEAHAIPLIVDAKSLVGWEDWAAATGDAGIDLSAHPRLTVPDASLAYEAAVSGQGIWLTWPLLASAALSGARLVAAGRRCSEFGLGYWLVSTPARWRRPQARAFRDWAVAKAEAATFQSGDPAG